MTREEAILQIPLPIEACLFNRELYNACGPSLGYKRGGMWISRFMTIVSWHNGRLCLDMAHAPGLSLAANSLCYTSSRVSYRWRSYE